MVENHLIFIDKIGSLTANHHYYTTITTFSFSLFSFPFFS